MAQAQKPAWEEMRSRALKNSSLDDATTLDNSVVFNEKDKIRTSIPALNIATGGAIDGGFSAGLTIFAGPSKHFKSMLGLRLVSAYLKKHDDAVCVFIDSEFGITPSYLKACGVEPARVIHCPVYHIEQAKFETIKQLDNIKRGDHVIIFMDSLGNCASKKELDDAIKEDVKVDMSRAKSIKSYFRMVTPYLTMKNVPMVVINHVYDENGLFPKTIMGGGTGPYLSADEIFFITRSQNKASDKKTVLGYTFTLVAEKSRYIKEKSKIPLDVSWENGVNPFSALLELGLEQGAISETAKGSGKFNLIDENGEIINDKPLTRKTLKKDEYIWLLKQKDFCEYVKEKYQIPATDESERELVEELEGVFGE